MKIKMLLYKGSAAMGFQVKEIKRQSRAVKITHPPAERRQLHKRSDSGSGDRSDQSVNCRALSEMT